MYMTVLKMTRSSILSATDLLDINSSNSVHKWLTEQQDTHRAEGKILYKIISRNNEIYMYIQSKDKFNLTNIEKYGFELVKEFENDITNTGIYQFDLQVFPCKTHDDKRYFLKDINDRYLWLQRQFNKYNIDLLECAEYRQTDIIFDKDKVKNIPTSTFRGKIQINNIEQAQEMIENGVGRFKNYGLGLLLLKAI